MVTLAVPSETKKIYTREDVLKKIVRLLISPIFIRSHLSIYPIIGIIGDRGGGKSGSSGVISLSDAGFSDRNIFSNMDIEANIRISDSTAQRYGLKGGGIAHYQSKPLDKDALLNLDEQYINACILIEEINVQYSNVRRIMSNTNVDFNEVAQQLRKYRALLIYNVINEMFIDPQLRSLTDIFIRTYDTAFDVDSLERHKPNGLDFSWKIYPMTGYLRGEQGKYSNTHEAIGPVYLNFEPWRGIFDSMKHQEQGRYTKTTSQKNRDAEAAALGVESSPEIVAHAKRWGWLEQKVLAYMKANPTRATIEDGELPMLLGRSLTPAIKRELKVFGIHWDNEEQCYDLPSISDPLPLS